MYHTVRGLRGFSSVEPISRSAQEKMRVFNAYHERLTRLRNAYDAEVMRRNSYGKRGISFEAFRRKWEKEGRY